MLSHGQKHASQVQINSTSVSESALCLSYDTSWLTDYNRNQPWQKESAGTLKLMDRPPQSLDLNPAE